MELIQLIYGTKTSFASHENPTSYQLYQHVDEYSNFFSPLLIQNDRTAAEFARLREQKALEAEAERRRMLLLGSRSHGDSSQSRTRLTDDETFGKVVFY